MGREAREPLRAGRVKEARHDAIKGGEAVAPTELNKKGPPVGKGGLRDVPYSSTGASLSGRWRGKIR